MLLVEPNATTILLFCHENQHSYNVFEKNASLCFLEKKSIFGLLGGSSVFFTALGHSSPVEQLLFFGAVSVHWSHVSESWLIQFTVLIPGKN